MIAAGPDVIEILQAIVRDELSRIRIAEVGVVTELFSHESDGDQNNYACSVKLRDTGLELPRVPLATGRIGLAAIPNVDDLVMVQFIGGSLHGAIITGRLYNDVDRPPVAKAQELVYICPDGADSSVRRFHLEYPNGNKLTLDDGKFVFEAGSTKLTINNAGDVEITSNANIALQSQGDMNISSGGAINIKATTDLKLEGLSASIKAQTSAQLEGQATTTIKGPVLSLAGITSFSPS